MAVFKPEGHSEAWQVGNKKQYVKAGILALAHKSSGKITSFSSGASWTPCTGSETFSTIDRMSRRGPQEEVQGRSDAGSGAS